MMKFKEEGRGWGQVESHCCGMIADLNCVPEHSLRFCSDVWGFREEGKRICHIFEVRLLTVDLLTGRYASRMGDIQILFSINIAPGKISMLILSFTSA